MKTTIKVWSDTQCADVILEPETDMEAALVGLLCGRKSTFATMIGGKMEIVFPQNDPAQTL